MTMVIMYSTEDGGVQSANPALNLNAVNDAGEWIPLKPNQAPPEGYRYPTIQEAAAKLAPADHIIIDDSTLPDRDKRDAWVIQDGAVVIDESRVVKPPLAERLADKFRGLLTQYGSQVSKQTRKEIMELEARGNRYLQFGLADDWQQDIADYTPADPADQALVAQLKQVILEEF